jgi:hypothetical protein
MISTINQKAAAKARNASFLGLKPAQITVLRQKLNAYRTATRKQMQTIKELEEKIRNMGMSSIPDPFERSIDRIFTDLGPNREQAPSHIRRPKYQPFGANATRSSGNFRR